MYNNDYMYAIERSDDYLAHYGVRGMKWGVRKARKLGLGTARGAKALGKQYAKAQKKLAKLDKAAANSKKYVRRAALMGAGAAAAGGLAAAGTHGVSRLMRGAGNVATSGMRGVGAGMTQLAGVAGRAATASGVNPRLRSLLGRSASALSAGGKAVTGASGSVSRGMRAASSAVGTWGNSNSLGRGAERIARNAYNNAVLGALKSGNSRRLGKISNAVTNATGSSISDNISRLKGVSNNTIARIGAGAVGAGLAAGAARNAYKAATAQKKAAKFRSEMNKAFAGTKYANGGGSSSSRPRQGKKRRRS